jgi:hypothetical protein
MKSLLEMLMIFFIAELQYYFDEFHRLQLANHNAEKSSRAIPPSTSADRSSRPHMARVTHDRGDSASPMMEHTRTYQIPNSLWNTWPGLLEIFGTRLDAKFSWTDVILPIVLWALRVNETVILNKICSILICLQLLFTCISLTQIVGSYRGSKLWQTQWNVQFSGFQRQFWVGLISWIISSWLLIFCYQELHHLKH